MTYQAMAKAKILFFIIIFLILLFVDTPEFLVCLNTLPDEIHDLPRFLSHEKVSTLIQSEIANMSPNYSRYPSLLQTTEQGLNYGSFDLGDLSFFYDKLAFTFHEGDRRLYFFWFRDHRTNTDDLSIVKLVHSSPIINLNKISHQRSLLVLTINHNNSLILRV